MKAYDLEEAMCRLEQLEHLLELENLTQNKKMRSVKFGETTIDLVTVLEDNETNPFHKHFVEFLEERRLRAVAKLELAGVTDIQQYIEEYTPKHYTN